MRYALIGCGRIAEKHVKAAVECGLDIVGLCDICPEHAQRFDLPAPIFEDYTALIESSSPTLVAIATDSGIHAKIALELIRRGIHVMIEKPMALCSKEAAQIEQEAKRMGVLAVPCHQNRYNAAASWLKKAIRDGGLGKLMYGVANVRWRRDESYYRQAPWRGSWAGDGGVLMNQSIHAIDMLIWMMGRPVELVGHIERFDHPYIEAEDFGTACIRFESGAIGIIEATSALSPQSLEETLCLFGTGGSAKIGGLSMNRVTDFNSAPIGDKALFSEEPPDIYGFGHTALYRDVVRAIESGGTPLLTSNDGRLAVETVLSIYRSAREGRSVALFEEDFGTDRMKGYFKEE